MKNLMASLLLAGLLVRGRGLAQEKKEEKKWPAWIDRITVSGDFRVRHEGFFQTGKTARQRERLRARLGLSARVNDQLRVGLRIASGSLNDPISTNQSLTGFATTKGFNLDQAYLTYEPVSLLKLTGGKFGHPIFRPTQLIWDDDLNPEGFAQEVVVSRKEGGLRKFALRGLQYFLNEVGGGTDAWMVGGQAFLELAPAPETGLSLALSDFRFFETDQLAVAIAERRLDPSNGNTNLVRRDAAGKVVGFQSEFNLIHASAQLEVLKKESHAVKLFLDVATNTEAANDQDLGFYVGAELGKAAKPGQAKLGFTYFRVEQEAVLSPFSFSDIPGTNVKGGIASFSVQPISKMNLDLTAFFSKKIEAPAGTANNTLTRVQLDARVSF